MSAAQCQLRQLSAVAPRRRLLRRSVAATPRQCRLRQGKISCAKPAPWGSAQEVSELIEEVPGGLERYRPQLRYCLVDEVRIADSELESLWNLTAALFRLEKSRGPEDVQRILVSLIEWLREPGLEELRRSFTQWLQKVFLPDRVEATIPQVADLQEVKSMLAERVKEWSHQWKQEGRQEGLEKARGALVQTLERRFGRLPEEIRRRVEGITSIEELIELSVRAGAAPSLAALYP
jgi:hypothetical protein